MSDLCNNCGNSNCGCGCDNGCGNTWGLFGNNNDCCSILWILILIALFGNSGWNWGNRSGNNSCLWIILILFFCNGSSSWNNDGCGCGCGC